MKKLVYVLIFGVASLSLNSCDWFDDVTKKDVNFTADLPVLLHVVQNEEGEITDEIALDPLSDDEFDRYKDDIKNIEITSLSYKISELKSDHQDLKFDGKIEYKIGAKNKASLANLTGVDIKSLAASGAEQNIEIPSAALAEIIKAFEDHNEVTLFLSGKLSEVPVDFKMEIIAKLKVQAEVEL